MIEQLTTVRAELAQVLNNSTWADFDLADRMAGSARGAANFIDQIIAASGPKAAKETAMLLERKRAGFSWRVNAQRLGTPLLHRIGATRRLRL